MSLLLALAAAYNLIVQVNRESPDSDVQKAFRKVATKVHPDKGGSTEDSQRLLAARAEWQRLVKEAGAKHKGARATAPSTASASSSSSSPAGGQGAGVVISPPAGLKRSEFRIQGMCTLLTYQGLPSECLDVWEAFKKHITQNQKKWRVKHYCATLETNADGKGHMHVMLQFTQSVDTTITGFIFRGYRPNASEDDYMGEGYNRRRMQVCINRGMFYVFADKIGTQRDAKGEICVAANYWPCWVPGAKITYPVSGRWPESLWKAHKLTHSVWDNYLYLCRDGVPTRKRNLEAVMEKEKQDEEAELIRSTTQRIQANRDLYQPFPAIPVAVAWLALFASEAIRYPLLLVLGKSHTGKTQWANSLFKNSLEMTIGGLLHFPERMRLFDRRVHDGLVLDDVRDLEFLSLQQDKLQSTYHRAVEFASTPGGKCAFQKYLFRIPIVVTCNYSTANLKYLETHDFLKLEENRIVVEWPAAWNAVRGQAVQAA